MKKLVCGVLLAFMTFFASDSQAFIAKWSQLPSMSPGNGYAFSSETQVGANFASQVADDFQYRDGDPIIGMRWWGSFWDTRYGGNDYPPYRHSDGWGDPDMVPPDVLTGFNITFYQDVPAGTAFPPWSHPGAQSGRTYTIDIADVTVQKYGEIHRTASVQTVFQYDIIFNDPLALIPGTIYWVSIQAVDDNRELIQWGWQESVDHWNDNAVQTFPGLPYIWDMLPGEDMAFELNTVPVPTTLLLLASGILGLVRMRRGS